MDRLTYNAMEETGGNNIESGKGLVAEGGRGKASVLLMAAKKDQGDIKSWTAD